MLGAFGVLDPTLDLLFDLDGVITQTATRHAAAWNAAAWNAVRGLIELLDRS